MYPRGLGVVLTILSTLGWLTSRSGVIESMFFATFLLLAAQAAGGALSVPGARVVWARTKRHCIVSTLLLGSCVPPLVWTILADGRPRRLSNMALPVGTTVVVFTAILGGGDPAGRMAAPRARHDRPDVDPARCGGLSGRELVEAKT